MRQGSGERWIRRASRRVFDHFSLQSRLVLISAAPAIGGLLWLYDRRVAAELAEESVVLIIALLGWTVVALVALVSKRLDGLWGVIVVTTLVAICLLQGLTFSSPSMRWIAMACLLGLPTAAIMLLGRRLVLAISLTCAAGSVVIAMNLDEAAPVRIFVALLAPLIALVPTVVIGVLVERLHAAKDLAEFAADSDQLTGLANRRGMWKALPGLLAAARHREELLVLAVADIDHFKRVNDGYGHHVGDAVLAGIADVFRSSSRGGDVLVRFGGEEIAWLSSAPSAEIARGMGERMRRAVEGWRVAELPAVTISIGLAVIAPPTVHSADSFGALFMTADAALYEAKVAGRNRVVVASYPSASAIG